MFLGRLILRFLLVPFGGLVAIMAAAFVICFAHWTEFARLIAADPRAPENIVFAVLFVGWSVALVMGIAAVAMLLPAMLGVMISEAFAIRSWLFHAANGALASWIGWLALRDYLRPSEFYNDPTIVLGAGIAAGFAYWAVAGWSAGFWKPVFSPPQPPKPAAA
jgi:hypothetical protein